MWSSDINNIPDGWALCNGSNGTPNLRDQFIVGAGDSYSIGEKDGENYHTLTISEIPLHSHKIVTVVDNSFYDQSGDRPGMEYTSPHSFNRYTTETTGSGSAHENRSPYYALAYIMKL